MFFNGHSKINGRKQGKNISLNGPNKKLQAVNEYGECDGRYSYNASRQYARCSKDEDETEKDEQHNVTCHYVRKKSNYKHDRLDENTHYFNGCEYDKYWNRNTWHSYDVPPVVLVPVDRCDDEGEGCKN